MPAFSSQISLLVCHAAGGGPFGSHEPAGEPPGPVQCLFSWRLERDGIIWVKLQQLAPLLPIQPAHPASARTQCLPQAVDPLDARLLPLVEALVDAGYRPRTFTDAPVHMEFVDEPVLRRLFDPLHVIEGDPGLQVAGANRCACAASGGGWWLGWLRTAWVCCGAVTQ